MLKRPDFLTNDHLQLLLSMENKHLDNLFEAIPYLLANSPDLTAHSAQEALQYFLLNENEAVSDFAMASAEPV